MTGSPRDRMNVPAPPIRVAIASAATSTTVGLAGQEARADAERSHGQGDQAEEAASHGQHEAAGR